MQRSFHLTRALVSLSAVLALGSCLAMEPDEDLEVGEQDQQVLTGTADSDYPGVVVLRVALPDDEDGDPQDPIFCTGTLVEECTVLTSAACVYENVEADMIAGIDMNLGPSFNGSDDLPIADIEIHRYYDHENGTNNQLAFIRIQEGSCPAVTPVAIYDQPITSSDVGRTITLVGYGVTVDQEQGESASRNRADTTVESVNVRQLLAGTDDVTTCAGDSGGPGIFNADTDPAMAVITNRQSRCFKTVSRTRLDIHLESFIYPYIDRFSGPCAKDEVCVTEGCRTPDPDCEENACAWGNECQATGCPSRDWDCEELGSFAGEACSTNDDCEEFGRCIAAIDDETFTYCSRPCDPAETMTTCPSGMECTDLGAGEGECTWLAPSPGSQGFACVTNDQCRSGICENDICVFECGDGNSCPGEFICGPSEVQPGTNVCLGEVLEGGGGFCAVGGDVRNWLAPLLLAIFGLPLVSRRRRRRK